MNTRSIAFVLSVAFAPLAAACSGAPSGNPENTAASEDDLRGKSVTFAEFKSAMNDALDMVAGAEGCTFDADVTNDRVSLKTVEGAKAVTFFVTPHNTITFSDNSGGDLSQRTYTIRGVGKIVLENADDAFNSIAMSSKDGTATCEADF
jgi:hypothetical protein